MSLFLEIRELVNKRMKEDEELKTEITRIWKMRTTAGGTDCCGINRKCSKELG